MPELSRQKPRSMKASPATALFRRLLSSNPAAVSKSRGRTHLFVVVFAAATLPVTAPSAHAEPASFHQLRCLAQNVYFEARGEMLLGQLGVAHVVMNRVKDDEFPATICDVVKAGGEARRNACQFSWWCDGRSDRPTDLAAWKRSFEVAIQVYFGRRADPTRGALWYHADYVRPEWRRSYVLGARIGRHLFYWRIAQPSWLLEGTVKPASTERAVGLHSPDIAPLRETGTQEGRLHGSDGNRTPNHKPRTPSRPSEGAVAALLESAQREIQESAALVPIGADALRTSQSEWRSRSRPTPQVQKKIRRATALVERARRAREGTGRKFVVAGMYFAPPQSRIPFAIVSGPLTPTQIKNIRLHFQGCWTVPEGSRDARNLVVRIRFGLLPDGSLRGDPTVVERPRMGARDYRAAAEAARRAVQECAPLEWLPEGSYEQWQEIELTFDPRDLSG